MIVAALALKILTTSVFAGHAGTSGAAVSVNLTVSDILLLVNAVGVFGNIAVSMRGKK